MIKYALRCEREHGFESWFPDSASYEKQRKRGLIDCPVCGSTKVDKQIMAPNIRVSAEIEVPVPAAPAAPEIRPSSWRASRAQKLRAMIREMHAHVAANTEDVGARFAEEARKIHAGEADDRAIRGRASLERRSSCMRRASACCRCRPSPTSGTDV